jgi:hypothetical protein
MRVGHEIDGFIGYSFCHAGSCSTRIFSGEYPGTTPLRQEESGKMLIISTA